MVPETELFPGALGSVHAGAGDEYATEMAVIRTEPFPALVVPLLLVLPTYRVLLVPERLNAVPDANLFADAIALPLPLVLIVPPLSVVNVKVTEDKVQPFFAVIV